MKKDSGFLILGILMVIGFWQCASLLAGGRILPGPYEVFATMGDIRSLLLTHLFSSLWRVFAAIGISVAIGLPLGILTGYFRAFDSAFSPVVFCMYPIPKIVFLPVAMLLLGLGNGSKILIMTLIIVFQVIVIVRDSVRGIPPEYFHQYIVAGAGFYTLCRRIIVPAALPGLLTAIRSGFATGISVLFFSESYGTRYGLGYFILDSWMRMNYRQMYAGIVVLAALGIVFYWFLDFLDSRIRR